MEFEKLPDIDIYVTKTTSIKEANEFASSIISLGLGFSFNGINDSYQFVFTEDEMKELYEKMSDGMGEMLEEVLDASND